MEQMQQPRQRLDRPRIPAVQCGAGATSRRLDRHLAVLGAPAGSQVDSAAAASLIRELTPRGVNMPQNRTTTPQRETWAAVGSAAASAANAMPVGAGAAGASANASAAAESGMAGRRARIARVSLLAPLRKLRRTLFGGR
ncbi:hypothetical protein [Phaeacidiphilus oryzae]|jgi:hypothetical protein|uniref:hypothetical protein n=1 Tax=Phaeacidiphilus oryzae TaxID=348818 RepID=UPI000691509A|nr:hypothetical protein [Phaeacidiphilus oryzae]